MFKALGKQLKPYLDKGALVPDNLSCSLIIAAVSDLEKERNSWLLDGINFSTHVYFLLQVSTSGIHSCVNLILQDSLEVCLRL